MTVLALILVGLAAGLVAATLGVGGGIIYVPSLVTLFSVAQHEAQGTSLAVIIPTAVVAATLHARAGRVDWRTAGFVAAGGLIGGFLGAQIALGVDEAVLRKIFAAFLTLAALRMLARTRGRAHGSSQRG